MKKSVNIYSIVIVVIILAGAIYFIYNYKINKMDTSNLEVYILNSEKVTEKEFMDFKSKFTWKETYTADLARQPSDPKDGGGYEHKFNSTDDKYDYLEVVTKYDEKWEKHFEIKTNPQILKSSKPATSPALAWKASHSSTRCLRGGLQM
jgi:hypothetical protein